MGGDGNIDIFAGKFGFEVIDKLPYSDLNVGKTLAARRSYIPAAVPDVELFAAVFINNLLMRLTGKVAVVPLDHAIIGNDFFNFGMGGQNWFEGVNGTGKAGLVGNIDSFVFKKFSYVFGLLDT